MKNVFLIFIFLLGIGIHNSIKCQDRGYGLGIMLGEPSGLNAKYWLDSKKALDFGLAYSFVTGNGTMAIHCDYVFHNNDLIDASVKVPVYYGFGARVRIGSNDNSSFGARGVLGILYQLQTEPVDIFAEAAPVFNLFPKTTLHLDIAIGARYFFR